MVSCSAKNSDMSKAYDGAETNLRNWLPRSLLSLSMSAADVTSPPRLALLDSPADWSSLELSTALRSAVNFSAWLALDCPRSRHYGVNETGIAHQGVKVHVTQAPGTGKGVFMQFELVLACAAVPGHDNRLLPPADTAMMDRA